MVMACIRLLGLPGFLYKRKILEEIRETIGKVVRLDFNTNSRIRGHFAKMVVYVNLDKPLVAQVLMSGLHQKVEHEALPMICFTCGTYGHAKELCASPQPDLAVGKDQKGTNLTEAVSRGEGAVYGPWIMVERKGRCNSRNNNIKKTDFTEKGKLGSRFDALANMEVLLDLKDELNKEDTGKLAGFKNKLKVGENVM